MKDNPIITNLDLSALDNFVIDVDIPFSDADKIFEKPKSEKVSVEELRELVEIATRLEQAKSFSGFNRWFVPGTPFGIDNLPKHRAFLMAGALYPERYLSAANRFGKTYLGSYETALHLTGLYPDWWEGKQFDKPTNGWACGQTSITTRDILQKELLGEVGSFGTGMIPKELIVKTSAKPGVPNAIETVEVRHVSGGVSVLGFKSYDQGVKAYFGTAKDFIWMDELPEELIYSECYIRTMTTNGIIYVTATPLDGLTPLVLQFYNFGDFLPRGMEIPGIVRLAREDYEREIEKKKKEGEDVEYLARKTKAVILGGWNDAPWLTEEAKARMLAATPPNLRQARSTGLPSMGSGSVYPIPLEEILCQDFPIPRHYKKVYGMDVGWNNTAAMFGALDPDTDTLYIYAEYKRGQAEPIVHAEAIKSRAGGDWVPGLIDPASRGRNQNDGKQLFNQYRQRGLKLIIADNAVEAGIYAVWERLSCGKLKVFRSCTEFQKEYVTYRRDDKGRVIKDNDHLCDGVRYLTLGLKHARVTPVEKTNALGLQGGIGSAKRYFE